MKPEVKYGVIAGFFLILWTLVQFMLNFHTLDFEYNKFSSPGVLIILFFTLLKSLKEKRLDYGGSISLRKGMRTGVFQLFITAFIASSFMFLYDYKINPLWIENFLQWEYDQGHNNLFIQLANEPFAANTEAIILSNTETHLCYYALYILIAGGILSALITSFISKKKIDVAPPSEEEVRDTAVLKNQ
jgi:hypothetical protein